MDEEKLVKFDRTEAELKSIVAETAFIIEVNIDNKDEIKKVKEARISIGKVITAIEEFGLNKRSFFTEINRKIMARQKELVAILEPEKDRLKAFEEEAKQKQEIADRMLVLPERKNQLAAIGDGLIISDEYLLQMDSEEFVNYINRRKNDYLVAREAKIKEGEDKLAKDKEIEDAKKKAREEEIEKGKIAIELAKEKAEIEKQEIIRKAEKEKQDLIDENDKKEADRIKAEEDKKKEEDEKKAKLAKDENYKTWLKENGMTEETKNDFVIQRVDGSHVRLLKIVAVYKED